jgi:hypothetical protein
MAARRSDSRRNDLRKIHKTYCGVIKRCKKGIKKMPHFDKQDNGTFSYSYNKVNGLIAEEYVCPERIEIYIEDELFWNAVRDSYKSIDLSGRNKRDMERFLAKHKKTAEWLRKQANGIYF